MQLGDWIISGTKCSKWYNILLITGEHRTGKAELTHCHTNPKFPTAPNSVISSSVPDDHLLMLTYLIACKNWSSSSIVLDVYVFNSITAAVTLCLCCYCYDLKKNGLCIKMMREMIHFVFEESIFIFILNIWLFFSNSFHKIIE